jgi:ribosomal protein S18 acetylase RimI-like enzyme
MSDSVELVAENSQLVDFYPEFYGQPFFEKSADRLNQIVLRRAEGADAELIASIASGVNIHKYAQHHNGFLVYSLTAAEYAKRISDGHYVFMFEYKGQSIGFLCGYDEEGLERYHKDNTLSHESSICKSIMEAAMSSEHLSYLFLDQVAILPSLQNCGLGERYFDLFCEHLQGRPFYGAMLEAPVRNPRIDFWRKRGFTRLGQVEENLPERFRKHPNHSVQDTFLWGIYLREYPIYVPKRS